MRPLSQHLFSMVPRVEIPRSSFDRSHEWRGTFDAGYLIPFFTDIAYPGDTFNVSARCFGRLATPIVPIMDNLHLDTFFFAVPCRILWDNFEAFMGDQSDPTSPTDYVVPTLDIDGEQFANGSIYDYLGYPTLVTFNAERNFISALPNRAYDKCYYDWFWPKTILGDPAEPLDTGDGPDDLTLYDIRRRAKRHDYFTSCMPWPQAGPEVSVPLGGFVPVTPTTDTINVRGNVTAGPFEVTNSGTIGLQAPGLPADEEVRFATPTGLQVNLGASTSPSVNQVRQAFQVQRMYERDARGGNRFTEIIRSHFGVISDDARLQRSEFLGGYSTPLSINPVAQTSSTDAETPQGNLAAFGTVYSEGTGFVKSFTEHCVLIGMMMVRADLNYQYGINRIWSAQTKFDWYWPSLAHIGEQSVLKQELYCDGSTTDIEVFGYQERFAELRYKPSVITSLFRSNATGSLDIYGLWQEYASAPELDEDFLMENPPVDRISAVPTEPHMIMHAFLKMRCVRPMPLYGVPGNIDRF